MVEVAPSDLRHHGRMSFTGIPDEAVTFYAELRFNNERAWWLEHKPIYDEHVRGPLSALADDLSDEFGPARLYRPHRDLRFSPDPCPYKDHQGASRNIAPRTGYYFEISGEGLMTAGGCYFMDGDILARYRRAVDNESTGRALERIVATLAEQGFLLPEPALKTAPRGFTVEHPRIDLLRIKRLVVSREHGCPDWLPTAETSARVRADWRCYRPLIEWIATHVA